MKRNLVGLVAIIVFTLIAMPVTIGQQADASVTSAASGWKEAIVDYAVPQWGGTIASDPQGNQHLIYYVDGAVKYATNKDGSWVSTIAEYAQYSQGREATILVGVDGTVHLTFFAYVDGGYPYWWHSEIGGGWMSTGLPIGNYVNPGHIVSIPMAINSNDVERGCFVDGGLNYLYRSGDAWATQVIDYRGVGVAGIAVDETGVTHIAYPTTFAGGGLAYASNSGGEWDIQTIETGELSEAAICLDKESNVHVLAVEHSGGLCHLVLLSLKDGLWTKSTVEDATNISASSVMMRSDGNITVAYYSSAVNGIMYGVLIDDTWSKVKVRDGPPSGRTSIAFDKEGSPCICYGKASYVTPVALPTFVLFS
jgi:hypothetical protein